MKIVFGTYETVRSPHYLGLILNEDTRWMLRHEVGWDIRIRINIYPVKFRDVVAASSY